MPITPAYEWQESAAWVTIVVKIPNVTRSSADIMTTECYVKVNSAPYFFEADLQGEVDHETSRACVGQSEVSFFLIKREPGLWERLMMKGDFKARLERRERSLQAVREHREKVRKEYPAKFSYIGRLAVGEHMKLEEMKRKVIEERKEAERLVEQEKINHWKNFDLSCPRNTSMNDDGDQHSQDDRRSESGRRFITNGKLDDGDYTSTFPSTPSEKSQAEEATAAGRSVTKDEGTFETIRHAATATVRDSSYTDCSVAVDPEPVTAIDGCDAEDDGCSTDRTVNGGQDHGNGLAEISNIQQPAQINKKNGMTPAETDGNTSNRGAMRYSGITLPAPRCCSTVCVTFSPKPDLPKHLPARESREREIKLRKSAAMREDTLDVSERAPLFLQDKGDKFFRAGDFQSAINAYTEALAQDSSLVVSLANRAACKLHLKDYRACVEDCSGALAILGGPQGSTEELWVPKAAPSTVPDISAVNAAAAAARGETKGSPAGGGLTGTNGVPREASPSSETSFKDERHQASNATSAHDHFTPQPTQDNCSDNISIRSHDVGQFDSNSPASSYQREEERILNDPSTEFHASSDSIHVPQPHAADTKVEEGDHDVLPRVLDDPSEDHCRSSCTSASFEGPREIHRDENETVVKSPGISEFQGQDTDKRTSQEKSSPLIEMPENSGNSSAATDPVSEAGSSQPVHKVKSADHLWVDKIPVERLELLRCLSGEGCCSTRGVKVEGAGVAEWKASMRKHSLVRRAVARCHLGDALKAADDFRKMLHMDPANQGVMDALAAIPTETPLFGPQGSTSVRR